jgi:hypothetical protein
LDEDHDSLLLEELEVKNPQNVKAKSKIVNEHGFKRELERRKLERQNINVKQKEVYNKMLQYVEGRFKKLAIESFSKSGNEKNNPSRV